MCCCQQEREGGDPGAPALDEAGSGCKARCCCDCCCWLQEGLLVMTGHVDSDLSLLYLGCMLCER